MTAELVQVDDLNLAIKTYGDRGFRLEMIFPADSPREATVSRDGGSLRLLANRVQNSVIGETNAAADWKQGRAGMMYRDLIPDRFGGKIIASNIRLVSGGDVPDLVHYHKIDFQMIYCVKGRIKVVYEDQGDPFWLETGDCVLQPPEIRHRVLKCTAGAEVIEVTIPAEHETWIDHDMELPNGIIVPQRDFNGQRFVRHFAQTSDNIHDRDLGISTATGGRYNAFVTKRSGNESVTVNFANNGRFTLSFELSADEILVVEGDGLI